MRRVTFAVAIAALLSHCAAWVDLSTPRAYPCDRDGGDGRDPNLCPSGWRCGLSGVCQDESVPAAYACLTSSDCEQGWHCGLNGLCHNPAVAAPYACVADTDCEQGWRCGLDGVCVDVSSETINDSTVYDIDAGLTRAVVSPIQNTGVPSHFSVAPLYDPGQPASYSPRRRRSMAFVADGGVSFITQFTNGSGSDDPRAGVFWRSPLPTGAGHLESDVIDVAVNDDTAWVLFRNGDVGAFSSDGGNSGTLDYTFVGNAPLTRLKVMDAAPDDLPPNDFLIALTTPPQILGLAWDSGFPSPLETVVDVQADENIFRVLSTEGLYVSVPGVPPASGIPSGLFPICLDGGFAGSFGPYMPVRLLAADNGPTGTQDKAVLEGTVGVELVPNGVPYDGGHGSYIATVDTNNYPTNVNPGCQGFVGGVEGPVPACPNGGNPLTPIAVRLIATLDNGGTEPSHNQFDVVCPSPDGGQPIDYVSDNFVEGSWNRNDAVASLLRHAVSEQTTTSSFGGFAGASGKMWLVDPTDPLFDLTTLNPLQPDLSSARTMVLDEQPLVVFSIAGLGNVASTQTIFYSEVANLGYLESSTQVTAQTPLPVGTVQGQPFWATTLAGSIVDFSALGQEGFSPHPVGVAASNTSLPPPPYLSQAIALPDGGAELLMQTYDQIRAADVTASMDPNADATTLAVRLVPIPGIPILSYVTLPGSTPEDGGISSLFDGYALTTNSLFAFSALTQERWSQQEIDIPIGGSWLKLWAEGAHVRLGFADGTVLSVPTKVQLAGALPDSVEASDFEQLCGYTFVLTSGGLYRLEAGSPLAQWVLQDSLGDFVGIDGDERPGAKFERVPGAIYVLGNSGRVEQVTPTGTPSVDGGCD